MEAAGSLPVVGVSEPSPVVGVSGPPLTAEVTASSLARVTLTVEEMMELVTCRYIDFLGVGVIDLEAPQLLEKVYEVAAERMFKEPTIMETIASVSKALQEYEHAGGFAPAIATKMADEALETPVAHIEPTTDVSAPLLADEGRETSFPQVKEAAEALIFITEVGMIEAVVWEVGSSPPRPVAAEAEDAETGALAEPAAAIREPTASEAVTRAVSLEI
jgi:hypothetical protein